MLRLFRKSSKESPKAESSNPSFVPGAHIEVWVQAEGVWAYGLYQRPVGDRHLVYFWDGEGWQPLAVPSQEIIPSTWDWASA